jgi:hypothetical protein
MLMAKANEGGEIKYEDKPVGEMDAVISNVFDLGIQETKWGPKHNVRFYWESEHRMTEGDMAGKRFLFYRDYNFTLGSPDGKKPSALREMIERVYEKPLPAEKVVEGFDLSQMRGKNCRLVTKKNGEYVNVDLVLPPLKDKQTKALLNKMEPELPADWVPPSVTKKLAGAVPQAEDARKTDMIAAANKIFRGDLDSQVMGEQDIF